MSARGPKLSLVPAGVAAPVAAAPPERGGGEGAPLAARDDDDLMLLARGGLPGAFATLVRRHQARALRVAARRLGRGAPATDVVQNTFLEVYRALGRYQPRGRFTSYLYRALLSQCSLAQRRARAEARAAALPAPPAPVAPPSQEAAILARERERDVEAALGRLGAKLRDVVLLRYSAELRYEEIAEALAIPVGTVKRRLFDAMERLRELLEERS
jgi:RNA polymerase sigma-70 factor (ECF subfamily)